MKLRLIKRVLGSCLLILLFSHQHSAANSSRVLSLNEAIRLALQHNLNMESSRDRVQSANISLEAAKSDFQIKIRPELSGLFRQDDTLDQSYGLRVTKSLRSGGELSWQTSTRIDEDLDESYQTDVTFAYTQPILQGRGSLPTTQELVSAQRSVRSQHRALILAEQQLMINVASAYYGILRDQMLMQVNQRALERAKILLQAAEAKLKVGMASKMDVFRAELQVLTSENGLIDAQESLENTMRQFNLLLGEEDLTQEYTLSSVMNYEPVVLDQERLIQQALDHRLELQEGQENINDAERQAKIAKQNLLPPLDLSVQYSFTGQGNAFEDSLDMKNRSWGIGVNSSFNLDFARDRASYQQAQLSLNGAIRSYHTTQRDIVLDVLQTITNVQQAQARVELQKQSVVQAEKQLELSQLRYKKGLSDNLDVIDAEESLIKANTSYYSAIVQHLIAKMTLKQSTGTLEVPF